MTEDNSLLPLAPEEGEASPFMERHRIDPRAVALIKANNSSLSDADLGRFLEVSAHLQLNPLLGEIYASRGRGRDGTPGRLLFMVGRDGLLKNAQRYPDYEGWDGDVVHAKDEFHVSRTPQGGRQITHTWDVKDRGEIIGAWAEVRRKGRPNTFFYAPFEEYCPKNATADSPWIKQPSVMIAKVPLSLALRLAFTLTGVVAEEEGARMLEDLPEPVEKAFWMDELAPDLRTNLENALDEAERVRPGQMSNAVVEMSCKSQPREAVEEFIAQVEHDNVNAAMAIVAQWVPDVPNDQIVPQPADYVESPTTTELADETFEDPPRQQGPTEVEKLQRRMKKLQERADTEGLAPEEIALADEEIEFLAAEIEKLAPSQGTLL